MKKSPTIDWTKFDFISEVRRASLFSVSTITALDRYGEVSEEYPYSENRLLIFELAFLMIMAGWEAFVENSLVYYTIGRRTSNGYQPRIRSTHANNIKGAYSILSRNDDFDINRNYLALGGVEKICKTADKTFVNHPYKRLLDYSEILIHATSIRNRIAHRSRKCRINFNKAYDYFTENARSRVKRKKGISPGTLLELKATRCFGTIHLKNGENILDAYCNLFCYLSNEIVPTN